MRFFEYVFVNIERKGKLQGSWSRTHKPEVGGSTLLPSTKNKLFKGVGLYASRNLPNSLLSWIFIAFRHFVREK